MLVTLNYTAPQIDVDVEVSILLQAIATGEAIAPTLRSELCKQALSTSWDPIGGLVPRLRGALTALPKP